MARSQASGASEVVVPLRIMVLKPVPAVALMLQRGRDSTAPPSSLSAAAVTLECTARARLMGKSIRWLGEYVQGPVTDRFIYVTVGKRAGQPDSPWDRRAKVKLASITPAQVREVASGSGRVLEARFDGVGRDGGPSCATVTLLGGAWSIARAAT